MNYTTYDLIQFPSDEIDVSLKIKGNTLYFKLYKDLNKSVIAGLIAIAKLRELYSEITVIMPFLAYSRSDSHSIISILQSLGVSRLITVEIHSENIHSGIEIYNITIIPEVIEKIGIDLKELVLISPDNGGIARVKNAADILNCRFISMEKTRENMRIKHSLNNQELVKNRPTFIVDDIIDSCGTINSAAEVLINCGAKSVKVLGIHGVLSKREFSPLIDKIYITNTIEQNDHNEKISLLNVDRIIHSKSDNLLVKFVK